MLREAFGVGLQNEMEMELLPERIAKKLFTCTY